MLNLPPVGESHAAYAVANIAKNTKAVFIFGVVICLFCCCFIVFIVLYIMFINQIGYLYFLFVHV